MNERYIKKVKDDKGLFIRGFICLAIAISTFITLFYHIELGLSFWNGVLLSFGIYILLLFSIGFFGCYFSERKVYYEKVRR